MCKESKPRHLWSPSQFTNANRVRPLPKQMSVTSCRCIQKAWLASRVIPRHRGSYLMPGAHRPINEANIRLALTITRGCAFDLFIVLWSLHPVRTTLMMIINVVRGFFPAFRGYSQAMIVDELQNLISSGCFTWSRLLKLLVAEIFRRAMETAIDSFASANENVVHDSVRFFVEYQQIAQRLRLDIPTLADPVVRDCLQESDLFVRSFNGMGGFGLLSPFDFVQILAQISELASHLWVLLTLTGGSTHMGALLLSILSALLPLFLSRCGLTPSHPDLAYTSKEARTAERQEKLRNLAYNDAHRPEVLLFGLGPWILHSWASARKSMMYDERLSPLNQSTLPQILHQINVSDLLFALQNIPLLLMFQSSSASLGSLALYRSSIQSVVYTVGNLVNTARMAFQSIFLMGAFCAAMNIKPRLTPPSEDAEKYPSSPNGMKIEARHLSYTYPGCKEPSLKDVTFSLEAGESLAIVGYNGSGKSTLAKVLLRIIDFDQGDLLVNGVDIRRLTPSEYHRHITTVFQGFSKYSSTVRENVGLGYVPNMQSPAAIEHAMRLGGSDTFVGSLPNGIKTKLDASGFEFMPYSPVSGHGTMASRLQHGLSGGEWQRLAVSRAFMRADRPEVDLLLFDEPTSSLDGCVQNKIFDTIDQISRSPQGEKTKTVIFITHRLSTARRADKIAMMENGTITEFGSHDDLLKKGGSYATLYRASV
ncbi:P-loop containing nucleoside triphosphate hydrolase protein [Rhizopogon vinicolor AM-OR11-026]|uniref:p-loop containing nucleoside triphosphate hydrolase protein n=1 Tax=Rhizopogon vinicolor AM-OR11-026 TaxID=1314800 RepID=A0A1B7NDV1_9AGAM|nr:P-loop containing nucleoside triphosphate hydrolase protein [Rhizopogon vinicolor AM-OR11-026]